MHHIGCSALLLLYLFISPCMYIVLKGCKAVVTCAAFLVSCLDVSLLLGVQYSLYLSKWNNHIPIIVLKLLIIVGDLAGEVAVKCLVPAIPIKKGVCLFCGVSPIKGGGLGFDSVHSNHISESLYLNCLLIVTIFWYVVISVDVPSMQGSILYIHFTR